MNKLIVGGFYGDKHFKESSIIKKLAIALGTLTVVNGGDINMLSHPILKEAVDNADLTIWAPDVLNDEEKFYPTKKKGSFLVCTKVMREGYGLDVAVSRIFKMHANAVIAIYKDSNKLYAFELVDALGNTWVKTHDIQTLADTIMKMYTWSKSQIRVQSNALATPFQDQVFIDLVKKVSGKVEALNVGRFFGNCSTRCASLFPSARKTNDLTHAEAVCAYVSPRDIDKAGIRCEDMIFTRMRATMGTYPFDYMGNKKPSVDTPIHLKIYEHFRDVNYIIHGHAYIKGGQYTEDYYPCGDLREFNEISNALSMKYNCFNLKNHGFIFIADSLEEMSGLSDLEFIPKPIGESI